MKRILFIAFILSQVLISTEGVLFAKSEFCLTVEQEAKSEISDEPEILERSRVKPIVLPAFSTELFYTNSGQLVYPAEEIPEETDFLRVPLFILQRSLRT